MSKIETMVVKPQVSFTENLIDYLLITEDAEKELDIKSQEITNFIDNNDGKGKSDEEKDKLYAEAQEIWSVYKNLLQDTKYNFNLNRPQWKFITDLILNKVEYDVNTVFLGLELTDLFEGMKGTKFNDDQELKVFEVNATEVTYIYHLISTHKIKGLTKDALTFSQILRKIGDISKVFNYYETIGKNLSGDVQDWVAAFEEGVTREIKNPKQTELQFEEEVK
jgi:hypothetical protein